MEKIRLLVPNTFYAVLLSLILSQPIYSVQAQDDLPIVTAIKGKVRSQTTNTNSNPTPVTKGEKLSPHKKLSTAEESVAKIKFKKDVVLTLSPNTEIEVVRLEQDGKKFFREIILHRGQIDLKVKFDEDARSAFIVKTAPALFRSNQGDFSVFYDPKTKQSRTKVKKGQVGTVPKNTDLFSVMIFAGQDFFITEKDYGFLKR